MNLLKQITQQKQTIDNLRRHNKELGTDITFYRSILFIAFEHLNSVQTVELLEELQEHFIKAAEEARK